MGMAKEFVSNPSNIRKAHEIGTTMSSEFVDDEENKKDS